MKKKALVRRIPLYRQRGENSIAIEAKITKQGMLEVAGQDVGKAPEESWREDDYEYGVVIAPEHKDKLLLALLERLYKGNPRAVTELKALLVKEKIPHDFHSWV